MYVSHQCSIYNRGFISVNTDEPYCQHYVGKTLDALPTTVPYDNRQRYSLLIRCSYCALYSGIVAHERNLTCWKCRREQCSTRESMHVHKPTDMRKHVSPQNVTNRLASTTHTHANITCMYTRTHAQTHTSFSSSPLVLSIFRYSSLSRSFSPTLPQ